MAEYLFPDFLSDPQQYQQAEALWRERFGDLIRRGKRGSVEVKLGERPRERIPLKE